MKIKSMGNGYIFDCPGCKNPHYVNTIPGGGYPIWEYNGNPSCPTFSPSLLVTLPEGTRDRADPGLVNLLPPDRCHSFVRDGKIQFLADCSHALAGQTVELPDIGEESP